MSIWVWFAIRPAVVVTSAVSSIFIPLCAVHDRGWWNLAGAASLLLIVVSSSLVIKMADMADCLKYETGQEYLD